jgi:tRNA pseudouridine55 synthase
MAVLDKLNGWIFLDKPIGMTSNAALQQIRRNLSKVKAGFVGTLDPLASGFLPVALGKSTKVINLAENLNKKYTFSIKWGEKTDTGDTEGKVIKISRKYPSKEDIKSILGKFNGTISQTPPKHSSLKVNGVRAYELARKKIPFKLKKRKVNIYKLEINNYISEQISEFNVECSSGTYVRSLAESISDSLGTLGTVTSLRREGFGNFNKNLISLDYFLSLVHSDDLNNVIEPVDSVFNWINVIKINKKQLNKVLKGNCIEMDVFFKNDLQTNDLTFVKYKNEIAALGILEKQNFYPKKVLIS